MELETDKAVVELPCSSGGKLLKIHVKQGQTVTPGTLIFTLEGNGAPTGAAKPASGPAAKPATPVSTAPASAAGTTSASPEVTP